MSGTYEAPYLCLISLDGITTAYLHVRAGHGRQARRRLVKVVYVPIALTPDSLPNVLRAVAHELELSPAARFMPPRGGLGSPSGAVGGENSS